MNKHLSGLVLNLGSCRVAIVDFLVCATFQIVMSTLAFLGFSALGEPYFGILYQALFLAWLGWEILELIQQMRGNWFRLG